MQWHQAMEDWLAMHIPPDVFIHSKMCVQELFWVHVCVFSCSTGQYPVFPDHRNEYGKCHVSDLPETVPRDI